MPGHHSDTSTVVLSKGDRQEPKIRLLKLLPRFPFGPIRCTFVEVSVDDSPRYEAISYTWGAGGFSDQKKRLTQNSQRISAT